jgi:hypothetical protein
MGTTSNSSFPGIKGNGTFVARTGETSRLEFEARDDNTGWITFGDTKYDLTKGIVFLVSTDANNLEVKQLDHDASELDPTDASNDVTRDRMQKLATSHGEIRAFFVRTEAGGTEP